MCKDYGIEFISSYPNSKTYPPQILEIIKGNEITLNPMKPNMMKLLENKLGGIVKRMVINNYHILLIILYVDYMKSRMKQVLEEEDFDHLVVSIGSGVTDSGLIKEFLQ